MGKPGYTGNSKPCTYKGVQYPSYTALGKVYGLAGEVVRTRLAKGLPLEERLQRRYGYRRVKKLT